MATKRKTALQKKMDALDHASANKTRTQANSPTETSRLSWSPFPSIFSSSTNLTSAEIKAAKKELSATLRSDASKAKSASEKAVIAQYNKERAADKKRRNAAKAAAEKANPTKKKAKAAPCPTAPSGKIMVAVTPLLAKHVRKHETLAEKFAIKSAKMKANPTPKQVAAQIAFANVASKGGTKNFDSLKKKK
jgi:hypothetical protein